MAVLISYVKETVALGLLIGQWNSHFDDDDNINLVMYYYNNYQHNYRDSLAEKCVFTKLSYSILTKEDCYNLRNVDIYYEKYYKILFYNIHIKILFYNIIREQEKINSFYILSVSIKYPNKFYFELSRTYNAVLSKKYSKTIIWHVM